MRVLLIDDDAIDCETVARALKQQVGTYIKQVATAQEAMFQIMNVQFDIVLMDYMLPDKDGLELLADIQKVPMARPCGIIMMSHNEDESLLENCLQFGAQDFIPKSEITSSKLKRCIHLCRKRFELEYYVKKTVEHSKYVAKTDALTGLKNRYAFEESLGQFLTLVQSQEQMAVVLLDVDNFKFFNESYGHEVGDGLLKKVASRLPESQRGEIDVARVGSNEFAIILKSTMIKTELDNVIKPLIRSMSLPYFVNGIEINCTTSLGYSVISGHEVDINDVIKYSNIALHKAKKQAGTNIVEFDQCLLQEIDKHCKIKEGIKINLERNLFNVAYQPIIDQAGQLASFEALVRWPNASSSSYFSPDEFVPVAEQSNDITRLGFFVFSHALKTLNLVMSKSDLRPTVSVNMSPIQLNHWELCENLRHECIRQGVPPNQVVLEITETALLSKNHATKRMITELSNAGFIISLDDFGTGFSSISHLIDYPINQVKIDRSVLPESQQDSKRINILKSLVSMCNSIGMRVVVEGIETSWQKELCSAIECHKMQGFYFSKPLSENDLVNFTADYSVEAQQLADYSVEAQQLSTG